MSQSVGKYFLCWSIGWGVIFQIAGCASSPPTAKDLTPRQRALMLIEIANGALLEGDSIGALQHLLQAEKEDNQLPELYHSKALAYFGKHDLKMALISAKKAIALKPDYADANNTLGKILLDTGKYKEAEQPLLTAARDPLYREAYKAWTNLGIIKYREGKFLEAENYLSQAAEESPNQACVAYYYLGHVKLKDQEYDQAIRDYSLATKKLCANFGEAHIALGIAYQKNRQYGQARRSFLEVQKRYPNTQLAERALEQLKYLP